MRGVLWHIPFPSTLDLLMGFESLRPSSLRKKRIIQEFTLRTERQWLNLAGRPNLTVLLYDRT
jgi:hypothetical protein